MMPMPNPIARPAPVRVPGGGQSFEAAPSSPTAPVSPSGPSLGGSGGIVARPAPVRQRFGGMGGLGGSPSLPTSSGPGFGMATYHKGTDYVPKTGPAVLKKGEAVLNPKDADDYRKAKGKGMAKKDVYEAASKGLGGKSSSKAPKKEVKEIRTRKGASGGFIHEHHHANPEHSMEEHTTPNQDAMVAHMLQHMGTPNPGEAEADAGQGGVPDAGGAPAGGPPPGGAAPTPGAGAGVPSQGGM